MGRNFSCVGVWFVSCVDGGVHIERMMQCAGGVNK